MRRFFDFGRRHPVITISVAALVAVVSASAAWAVNYDHHSATRLLPGTVIGGVPVGGLGYQEAVDLVRARVEVPLHRTVHVETDQFAADTTPWDLGLRVDVPAVVRQAMQHSHDGNIVTRLWRRLFGHDGLKASTTPKWGSGDLNTLLERAARAVSVDPHNASVDTSSGWVVVVAPKTGRVLDLDPSRRAVLDAVDQGRGSARLVTRVTQPQVGADAVSKVILVRTGENQLYLYENGQITKSWPVATGQAIYPTPTGMWRIVQKLVNPTWVNPNSSWSSGMPATIPPGPSNPLGTRALALSASGILIHATSDVSSIGFSASHGCIRMNPADELDLFGRVGVGTPVAIVKAAPPKPRTATATPAPATPTQAAAVQY